LACHGAGFRPQATKTCQPNAGPKGTDRLRGDFHGRSQMPDGDGFAERPEFELTLPLFTASD
jgi:hypothetical protein